LPTGIVEDASQVEETGTVAGNDVALMPSICGEILI
jgi:hypothetical protein